MAVFSKRIINAPSAGVVEMLQRRLSTDVREKIKVNKFNCVGMVNASISDIYFYADVASKAGSVLVAELSGSCPQHITTLVLIGEVSAVHTAMRAIEQTK